MRPNMPQRILLFLAGTGLLWAVLMMYDLWKPERWLMLADFAGAIVCFYIALSRKDAPDADR